MKIIIKNYQFHKNLHNLNNYLIVQRNIQISMFKFNKPNIYNKYNNKLNKQTLKLINNINNYFK